MSPRLRRSLAGIGCPDALVTSGTGYRLVVANSEVDALLFAELVVKGRSALSERDPAAASERFRHALSLWHGPALADVRRAAFAGPAAAQLEGSRMDAMEALIDARLQLGEHGEVVSELERLIAAHPLREHLHAQLMTALYRSGRQVDALGAFQRARNVLVAEVGVEPGRELRELELAVLRQAPELDAVPPAGRSRGRSAVSLGATVSVPPSQELGGLAAAGASSPRREGSERGERFRSGSRRKRLVGAACAIAFVATACTLPLVIAATASSGFGATGVGELATAGAGLVRSVPLSGVPGGAAEGDGSVWVTSPESGMLYRVDPSSASVEATVQIGNGAGAVAVDGPDVWVANTLDDTVARVSATTDTVVETVAVGSEPSGLAIGDGRVWVADSAGSTLSEVNPATGQVSNEPLVAAPFGVAVGDGSVWVTNPGNDEVTRIAAAGGPPVEISVGSGPTAVVFAFGSAWAANGLDSTVSRIDPATDSVSATIAIGDGPDALVVAGGSLWAANRLSSTLSRIDPASDSVSATLPIGASPLALAAWGRRVWAATGGVVGRPSGGTLRVVQSVPTLSIDPARAYGYEPAQFYEGTYDTLVTFQRTGGDEGLQIVPDLALAMPTVSDGGLQYSFVLRQGLRYSDGRFVRPEDFRRAIERVLQLDSANGFFFTGIVGTAACTSDRPCNLDRGITVSEATDAVVFNLTTPDPDFLDNLTLPFNAPVPLGTPDHDVGTNPVPSTGPYMISRYVPGKELVFSRNLYFHEWSAAAQPAGLPDRIVWTFGVPEPSEIVDVASGRADWTSDSVPDAASLAAQYPTQVHVNPAFSIDYVAFNTRVAPFNDKRVRQAFSLAADRSELATMLGGPDVAVPTCQLLPRGISGYEPYCPFTVDPSPAGAWLGPDLPAARKLVAESGTKGMRIVFWDVPGTGPTTNFASSVLRSLGYRVSVVSPSLPVFFENVNDSRKRVQVSAGSVYLDYPTASDMFDQFFRCSSWKLADPGATHDGSFYCDPRLDALMSEADRAEATDPSLAASIWGAVDRGVTDDAPWVALATLTQVDFVSARVRNYQYSPTIGVLLDQLAVHQ